MHGHLEKKFINIKLINVMALLKQTLPYRVFSHIQDQIRQRLMKTHCLHDSLQLRRKENMRTEIARSKTHCWFRSVFQKKMGTLMKLQHLVSELKGKTLTSIGISLKVKSKYSWEH